MLALKSAQLKTVITSMNATTVKETFRQAQTIQHYSRAAAQVGLWESEEKLFRRFFRAEDSLLDLGCGAGRVSIGLWEGGFRNVLGVDFSPEMIREARRLSRLLDYGIPFRVGDATALNLDAGVFDGVVFAFNGWMQIPGRERRRRALCEIHKVLRPGGCFIFTTHDREHRLFRSFLALQEKLWAEGRQDPLADEFGDNFFEAPEGNIFMHLPDRNEVEEDLAATGWVLEFDATRSDIANEPVEVREFSEECRFRVARKPGESA